MKIEDSPWPRLSQLHWVLICFAIGIWWCANLYRGFEHDAVFYAAEALNRIGAADFSQDPFFKFGAQGRYSLFIAPYGEWVRLVGVHQAAWWLTFVSKLAWLGAVIWLARSLIPACSAVAAGVAVVLLLPTAYEPFNVFTVSEPFATPRIVAECLSLAALALQVRGRVIMGWALTLVACGVHPLMGVSVAAVASLVWLMGKQPPVPRSSLRRVFIAALLFSLGICGLGLLRIAPFDGILQTYDSAWWDIVVARCSGAIVQSWDLGNVAHYAGLCLLLGMAAWRLPAVHPGRSVAIALAVTVPLCVLAWLLGSLTHNVLLVQLQPWRAMWLLRCTLPLIWVASLRAPRDWTASDHTVVMLLGAACLSSSFSTLAIAFALLSVLWLGQRLNGILRPEYQRWVAMLLLACLIAAHIAGLPDLKVMARFMTSAPMPWLQALAWDPVLWLIIGGLLLWLNRRQVGVPALLRWPVAVTGLVALLSGTAYWIAMSHNYWQPAHRYPALQAVIPKPATVYWRFEPDRTWLDLGRSHYANTWQGASALFSRGQALELQRRLQYLKSLDLASGPDVWPDEGGGAQLDDARVRALCQDKVLDVVISDAKLERELPRIEVMQDGVRYDIFMCRQLRGQAT